MTPTFAIEYATMQKAAVTVARRDIGLTNCRRAMTRKQVYIIVAGCGLYCAVAGYLYWDSCRPRYAGEESRKAQCCSNLNQIGVALRLYREDNGHFPKPVFRDEASGCVHSWRVAILPYLDRTDLHSAYDFSEPWDSDANARVSAQGPTCYVCPSDCDRQRSCTNYVMIVQGPQEDQSALGDEPDPESVIVVEVKGTNIHWAEPRDIPLNGLSLRVNDASQSSIGSAHPGGAHVLHCDGSVEFIEDSTTATQIRELLTGGQEPR